jgi:ATP-dependent Clp protease ATP-binding subunit ClpC
MFERFTDRARRVVVLAQENARLLNHNYIGTEHILLGLLHESEGVAAKALESLGISLDAVRQQVEEIIGQGQQAPSGHIPFTPRSKKVLELSLREALELGVNYIGTEHILLGLIREGDGVAAQVLVKLGAELSRVRQRVMQLLDRGQQSAEAPPEAPVGSEPTPLAAEPERPAGRHAAPAAPTFLDGFGQDLTQAARAGTLDPVIGRDTEIGRVMQVLSRRTQNNPVLVGAPGVGKTAVVHGLAQRIVTGDVPGTLADCVLYALDLGLLAGASRDQADLTVRMKKLLDEITARADIIVVLDGMHIPAGGVAAGPIDTARVLRQMLAREGIRITGTMTPEEYRQDLAGDAALGRRFQQIQVPEPTVPHTIEILEGLRDRYEAHHHVRITDGALTAAAHLAAQQLPERQLPGKAIDLMDEAASMVRIDRDADVLAEVTEEDIAETIAVISGLPPGMASTQDPVRPPFRPAAMTAADREIWAMA